MKINLHKIKSHYTTEISRAKANNYEAAMVPIECDLDIYCLNNIDDEDYLLEVANDYGWDKFLLIDFINKTEKLIDIYKLEAA